jgi:serine phosphatase RsbU (regulator of sigma subunit)
MLTPPPTIQPDARAWRRPFESGSPRPGYCCCIPADGTIDLANAGHSPVLALVDPKADPILLTPHLPPIGVVETLSGEMDSIQLADGGLLAVMSDGLSEARSPTGQLFGIERLQSLLQEGAAGGVRSLEELIFSRVEDHAAGAARADDQTMLLLQRRAA